MANQPFFVKINDETLINLAYVKKVTYGKGTLFLFATDGKKYECFDNAEAIFKSLKAACIGIN